MRAALSSCTSSECSSSECMVPLMFRTRRRARKMSGFQLQEGSK